MLGQLIEGMDDPVTRTTDSKLEPAAKKTGLIVEAAGYG